MDAEPARPAADGSVHWRRNLFVCLFGSFTTLVSMSLLLPFLPIYVEHLGVTDPAAIVQWSGVAFGATFLAAGLTAPIWGRVADRYGRKLILMRASLGMAIAMSMMGLAQNVWQLVALRLLVGLLGGYASGSVVLVATQTPKDRSGWALGMLSTGTLAGTLVGPLIGGALPGLVGIRETFFLTASIIFVAFIATCLFVKEDRQERKTRAAARGTGSAWSHVPDKTPLLTMLGTGMLLLFANMSIEPIITVYVGQVTQGSPHVALISGIIMSAAALGAILAAPRLGRLADRIGAWRVVIGCLLVTALLLIPQAFVSSSWQLIALRFLMGMSLAGLLPAITSLIRHNVPDTVAGTMLGWSTSAQYAGQVLGPLAGGFIGGHYGMQAVFFMTSAVMLAGAGVNAMVARAYRQERAAAGAAVR